MVFLSLFVFDTALVFFGLFFAMVIILFAILEEIVFWDDHGRHCGGIYENFQVYCLLFFCSFWQHFVIYPLKGVASWIFPMFI